MAGGTYLSRYRGRGAAWLHPPISASTHNAFVASWHGGKRKEGETWQGTEHSACDMYGRAGGTAGMLLWHLRLAPPSSTAMALSPRLTLHASCCHTSMPLAHFLLPFSAMPSLCLCRLLLSQPAYGACIDVYSPHPLHLPPRRSYSAANAPTTP